MDVTSVNPDFPVSDPTVFQKRYLKKIRELGEVRMDPPKTPRSFWVGWDTQRGWDPVGCSLCSSHAPFIRSHPLWEQRPLSAQISPKICT